MKTSITSIFIWFACHSLSAQISILENQKEKTKAKVNQRIENRIDRGVDKTLDKIENKVDEKGKKKTPENPDSENQTPSNENQSMDPEKTGASSSSEPKSFKSFSKFDFIPGEKVLFYDNFDHVAIGDFPMEFNTNGSGEVMSVEGRTEKWFGMTQNGSYVQEGLKYLPENFTLEFEVGLGAQNHCNSDGFGLRFFTDQYDEMDYHFGPGSYVSFHPGGCPTTGFSVSNSEKELLKNSNDLQNWNSDEKPFVKISIWRQGTRLRLYVDETKVWDIPRFFAEKDPYKMSFFHNFYDALPLLVTNIRIATAPADSRNKLMTEGKLVSLGILFDVNSDQIKPESYGALKEIAGILNEAAGVQVQIVGHTDSDGDDKTNLELSKKRALAVKKVLVEQFNVAENRLSTDGKGESEPTEQNTTATGKANNRRVEFIKK